MNSSGSESNFSFDSRRERVLADFLNTGFYPKAAEQWTYTQNKARQRAGEDVVATFKWLSSSRIIDEKAQSSDRWINSPSPTFAMEIYSETWRQHGQPKGSIGWFIHPKNETQYYVLVWLPDVSLFSLTQTDKTQIHYQPATVIDSGFSGQSEHRGFEQVETNRSIYSIELDEAQSTNFDQFPEPVPNVITDTPTEANRGERYYSKNNIHEAKIAVVEKQKIKEMLAADGLGREEFIELGKKAMTENQVSVDSPNVRQIVRSGDGNSGSGDGENPVIAVVPYDTYHKIADKTYHYKLGCWNEDVRLFY